MSPSMTPSRYYCPHCGTADANEDGLCSTCHEHYHLCPRCSYPTSNGNPNLCGPCQEEHEVCHECNQIVRRREAFCHPDAGGWLCHSCYREYRNDNNGSDSLSSIHNYSYKPLPLFYPYMNSTFLYFGVELETDGYNNLGLASAVEDLRIIAENDSLFYLKEDGSLDNGVEIVSHPATLEYHRKSFPWNEIQEVVYTNGGKSHNTSTCGLHVHFNASYLAKKVDSNQWYRQVRKLMVLFQRNYIPLYDFSRRSSPSCTNALPLFKANGSLTIIKDYKRGRHSRSYIVNICPRHSVEIRLFRGTLRHETMIAALELTDFMIRFAKRSSWSTINNTSWEDLVSKMKVGNYEYLPTYLAQMPESLGKGDGEVSSAPLPTEPIDEAPPPKAAREKKGAVVEEPEPLFISDDYFRSFPTMHTPSYIIGTDTG